MNAAADEFPLPEGCANLANWRTAPFNRWAFHHVREIVPSAEIPNDPTRLWNLHEKPVDLNLDGFLEETQTDGIVVLHRGIIVYERYPAQMGPHDPHILMSVSKSMLGLLAGILAARGILEPEKPVAHYVPEVASSAYRGATLRHLLDMRAGIAFDEDYLATSGPIIVYRKATGWNPLAPGETASGLRSFYAELRDADGEHGAPRLHYVSPNTDLLGWVIERAAGRRYADLMSELLWRPMGAERSAYITVDRFGAPRCAGGMCATVRDLARVGQLIVEGGRRGGAEVVPAAWIDDIERNGDPEAWRRGSFVDLFPGLEMHYRSQWYVLRDKVPLLMAFGIHGQNLYVDRVNAVVIAKVSSQALPIDAGRIAATTRAALAIRERLAG